MSTLITTTNALVLSGTEQDDNLRGPDGNELFLGLGGNDSIYAGNGDDTLSGGAGTDTLTGGLGNDTYVFERGMGKDVLDIDSPRPWGRDDTQFETIQMAAGIQPEEVILLINGRNLVIRLGDGLDAITVPNNYVFGFGQGQPGYIDRIVFDNGVVWSSQDIDAVAAAQRKRGTPQDDDIFGSQDADTLVGLAGNDYISAAAGDDVVSGDEGNDRLDGGLGHDLLKGGDGNDWLFGDDSGAELPGNDTLDGGTGQDSLYGYSGDDLLSGGDGDDTLYGGMGNDLLLGGEGDDKLFGETGQDTLDGGAGNDELEAGFDGAPGASRSLLLGGAGNDTLRGTGGDTLDGGQGDDIYSDRSSDTLKTYVFGRGSGDDTLLSGGGVLQLGEGISADDLVVRASRSPDPYFRSWDLSLRIKGTQDVFNAFDQWSDGYGLSQPLTSVVFADGSTWGNAELLAQILVPTSGDDVIEAIDEAGVALAGQGGNDRLTGWAGNEVISGDEGDDTLDGSYGDDTLQGGAGQDMLLGGYGNDLLVGGAGSDSHVFERDQVGWDVIDASSQGARASDELESILMSPNLSPSDILLRREGADLIVQSRYSARSTGQSEGMRVRNNFQLDEQGHVISLIDSISFGGNVAWTADDIITRSLASNVSTEGGDELLGDANGNVLAGAGGNDTLSAYRGNDQLSGGQGDDLLLGDLGDDTLIGGLGADTMMGGMGNDLYYVDDMGDQVVEDPNAIDYFGTNDTVATNLAEYTLPTGVDNLVMGGKAGDAPEVRNLLSGKAGVRHGVGNANANLMTGDLGAERFEGGLGNDTLFGFAGDDTLEGGAGQDVLEGGAGNDTYVLSKALETDDWGIVTVDTIVELAGDGSGVDTVITDSDTYTAPNNVEQVFGTGFKVNGNLLNNLLRGGLGQNYLSGNAGDDTLEGGGGNDQFSGGLGNDVLVSSGANSNDVYVWSRGDGADVAMDAGGDDRLIIDASVKQDQLWFSRTGDDLQIAIIGSEDVFTVQAWFQGAEHQIERITLTQGRDLVAGKVQQLVDAMASFTPPAQGQTALPADVAAQLAPVIASAWA